MDFDGEINQRDLERFLIEIVKVAKEEVQPLRMERLMKLMDVFKRGALHISEFKIVVEGRSSAEPSATSTLNSGGSCERDNFDWRLHAKQQISLALRQKYANVKDSFEGNAPLGNLINDFSLRDHEAADKNDICTIQKLDRFRIDPERV